MEMAMAHILVVSNDGTSLYQTLDVLSDAGHKTCGASTFHQAMTQIAHQSPDLIIADERLGEYNGLHVILSARAKRSGVGGIVTTPVKNRALEADAKSLNVECVVWPKNRTDWAASISRTLGAEMHG
jgi:CheY-like chemotaxis protein